MLSEDQKKQLQEANRLIKDVANQLDSFSRNEILSASSTLEGFISIDEKVTKDLATDKR